MSVEIVQMFTVKCDCCGENYESDEYGVWCDFDSAKENALDDGWIEKDAQNEHDNLEHFCPKCFTIDDEDMVTTKNGVTFQN